jgi:predicted ATPase
VNLATRRRPGIVGEPQSGPEDFATRPLGWCAVASRPNPSGQSGLLERERELEQLGALLDGLAAGEARVAIVEGAAGIGKSRLLAEARRRAADGRIRVLSARGGELERDFAFGVVRQLYEPVLHESGARERLLAGAAAAADPVFDLVEAAGEGDASFAVLHGLYWLTVNLTAGGPVLLAVDDLHWCDGASLRFLAYLARRLEGLPVLVLFGLRPSEPGVDTALLAELAGDPLATTLHPGALTGDAVAELVRERLGAGADARFVAACHAAAGGNPLLTNELLRALAAEGVRPVAEEIATVEDLGPRAASRATLLRLARLPDDAVAVARAVAVLGDGARVAHTAALAGLDHARGAPRSCAPRRSSASSTR